MMKAVKSPCTNECLLNTGTKQCESCLRYAHEIENWVDYTYDMRRAILRQLKERRKNAQTS